jgi:hypothetical protein
MILAQIAKSVKMLYNICTNIAPITLAKSSPIFLLILRARSPGAFHFQGNVAE